MATATTPTDAHIEIRCGRCNGTGRYGPVSVRGGICFDCHGHKTITTTRRELDAQHRRETTARRRQATRQAARIAELDRREHLTRLALDDLDAALTAEGPITCEDYRRYPAGFALANGTTEDDIWARGDGHGIDWVRHLWIRYQSH